MAVESSGLVRLRILFCAVLTLIPSCYLSYQVFDEKDGGVELIEERPEIEEDIEKSECPQIEIRIPNIKPTVVLLIDGSTSMQDPFRGTQESRWSVLRNALMDPKTGVVKPIESMVQFGLAIIAGSATTGCPFESKYQQVLPAGNNYDQINLAYPSVMPGGVSYTATGQALDQICSYLPSQSAANTQELGAQYILLASDGDPNGCPGVDFTAVIPDNDFEAAEAAARRCKQRGITIIPLSLADDVNQEHLQNMANIGSGTDNALVYQPKDSASLARDLVQLLGAVSCRIKLEMRNGYQQYEISMEKSLCPLNGGSVWIDEAPVPCGSDGWIVADSQHIELQGQACEYYRKPINSRVTVDFPCQTLVLQSQPL